MQKLIAKYGLAAHLAILAVAPLFLFPFCSDGSIARVLIWLTLPAALWTVLEPSMRGGERVHEARRRVAKAILRDPLLWASLALVVFTGLRALNTGITLKYNAEIAAWHVSAPPFPILPGVVGDSGFLPFAAALGCAVLMQACRHSLGRSARMSFLLLVSFLSGLASLVTIVSIHEGVSGAAALLPSAKGTVFSFVGFAFGMNLIGGLVALVALVEHRWKLSFFLLFLGIGGNAAGFFAFLPPYIAVAVVAVGILTLAYVVGFSCRAFPGVDGLKLLVIAGISLTIGGLLVVALLPRPVLDERLAAFAGLKLFPANFREIRESLSAMAFKSWVSHIWIGTGVASFPLDFRFAAREADWILLPRGATSVANGWWLLLSEQGLVGAVFFALPFGFLLVTYVRRLVGGMRGVMLPHPACLIAPLALMLFVPVGFVDGSPLRAEVLMVTCAFLAVSAATFQRVRGGRDG